MNTPSAHACHLYHQNTDNTDIVWQHIREEVVLQVQKEPILASFLYASILNHDSLEKALSFHLANILDSAQCPAITLREIFCEALSHTPAIAAATRRDIIACIERDPVCTEYSIPFLYYKGFHAFQGYRIAHWLWQHNRQSLAFFLQNRISTILAVDIHPAAHIGSGILVDHATGIVIGETAVIEDDVSILHGVTLGGTGKEVGDRHPKVRKGVLLSAHATLLGNIEIGTGAKVAAGSVVLQHVPPHTTVAGIPAKVVGAPKEAQPAFSMDHQFNASHATSEETG
jgi:serine O-acetyltransferase